MHTVLLRTVRIKNLNKLLKSVKVAYIGLNLDLSQFLQLPSRQFHQGYMHAIFVRMSFRQLSLVTCM